MKQGNVVVKLITVVVKSRSCFCRGPDRSDFRSVGHVVIAVPSAAVAQRRPHVYREEQGWLVPMKPIHRHQSVNSM